MDNFNSEIRIKVEDSCLSGRLKNILLEQKILYIDEIPKISRFFFKNYIRRAGVVSYNELSDFLSSKGIEWR